MKKRLILITIILVVIIAIIPFAAYFSLKSKNFRQWVTEKVEVQSGISVAMESFSISFPASIHVTGLSVKTPDGASLTAPAVDIHPSLLRLIRGRLYVRSAVITDADIFIPLDSVEKQPEPGVEKTHPTPGSEKATSGEPGSLPVGRVIVNHATLHVKRGATTTDFSDLNLDITPGTRFSLTGHPASAKNTFHVDGTLDSRNEPATLNASLEIADVQPALNLMGQKNLPLKTMEGKATLSAKRQASELVISMKLDFPTVIVTLGADDVPYPLRAQIEGRATLDGKTVMLNSSSISLRSTTIQLKGPVLPDTALTLAGKKLDLDAFTKLIPPSDYPFPESMRFKGTADLSGTATRNAVKAVIALSDAQALVPQLDPIQLNGQIDIDLDRIRIAKLLLTGPQIDLSVNASVNQYLSDHGTADFQIRGKLVNLSAAFKSPKSEKTEKTDKEEPAPGPADSGQATAFTYPDFEGMTHTLDCQIASLILPAATITNLKVKLKASDQGVFLNQFTGSVMDGGFEASGAIKPEPKGIHIQAAGKTHNLKTTALTSRRMPVEGGYLSSQFTIQTNGANAEQMKRTANGNMAFQITKASLSSSKVLLKIEELTHLKLVGRSVKDFSGKATLTNGNIVLSNTHLDGQGIHAELSGTASLSGDVDISAPVSVSVEEARNVPQVVQFFENKGVVTVPLRIKGTMPHAKVQVDKKEVLKEAKEKLKEKLFKRLFGN